MNRYITPTELKLLYPQAEDFSVSQVDAALKQSLSLVDSFLDTKLLPLLSKRFTEAGDNFPGILKLCQVQFARYILETINNGWSEELQSLYDNTANVLSKVTANELNIPDVNLASKDIGWKVVKIDNAEGDGFVEVRGSAPFVRTRYSIEFVDGTNYSITRDDGEVIVASIAKTYEWKNPFSGATFPSGSYADQFEIRFSGNFVQGNRLVIVGTPADKLNTSPSNEYITSGNIIYW